MFQLNAQGLKIRREKMIVIYFMKLQFLTNV